MHNTLTAGKIIAKIALMDTTEVITALVVCVIGVFIGQYLKKKIKNTTSKSVFLHFLQSTSSLIHPLVTMAAMSGCLFTLLYLEYEPILTWFLTKLSIAWFLSALALLLTSKKSAQWITIIFIIPITVLSLFGVWTPLSHYLRTIKFDMGASTVSIYQVLKTVFFCAVFIQVAKFITKFGEARLRRIDTLKSSDRALIIKISHITFYCIIGLISLDLLGVDISTITIFGGAIGVGLGFGLQKVTSNFISGIILLLEKSVEAGDLIELNDGISGVIKRTGARYTLIETSQGKEILVPNEDFVTQRVTNWTYSNHKGRVEIPINVSYSSDLELAQKLILEAASNHQHCLKDPKPECFLQVFAENAANFLLMFWIDDVVAGKNKPQSEIMFEIWRKFKEHGIEIPCPQRDVRIKAN